MKSIFVLLTTIFLAPSAYSKGYTKSAQFDVETQSFQRMHFVGLGLPRPELKYYPAADVRVRVDVVGETQLGADELLALPLIEKERELYIGNTSGRYSCELQKKNGKVKHIKGSCYERLVVWLPKSAKLEVYFRGERLTKVFVPISTAELMANLNQENFDDKRQARVDDFINSYKTTKVILNLHVHDISAALKEFSFSANQLEALEKLHKYAIDRENFAAMIDDIFWFPSDKKTARRIVGI